MNLIGVVAIALFARQYGVTCTKCHSVIPHLNEFGTRFLAAGERFPGMSAPSAFPLAAKINLAVSSERQGSGTDGQGLPKAIVDEVELFTAGTIGTRASYFVEQYVVDGGEQGLLRDAWVDDRVNSWNARVPVSVQAGSFTLPLPVDPETFRETAQHYALFDQAIGNNPFTFFDPKIGVKATIGDTLRGMSLQAFAGPGHDRQSGLATIGTDTMLALGDAMGGATPSIYRYRGVRPDPSGVDDHFVRTGYALVASAGRWTSESVLQTGWDSSVNGVGVASSGGLTQLRYAFNRRCFALARYESTNDANGVARDGVIALGYAPLRNARVTVEDAIAHPGYTTNTMNLQFTVGY